MKDIIVLFLLFKFPLYEYLDIKKLSLIFKYHVYEILNNIYINLNLIVYIIY